MRQTFLLLAAMMTLLLWLLVGCAKEEVRQRESSDSGKPTGLTRDVTIPHVRADLAANVELDVDVEGRIVFSVDGDIWTMNANGSKRTLLADGANPVWSPDGKKIAFTRDVEDSSSSASASASPASASRVGTLPQLYVMNADGSNLTKLLERNAFEPTWSPDGKRIAFSSIEWMAFETGAVAAQIYVTNADGSGTPKRLTAVPPDTLEEHRSPAWSPDGTKIAFVSDVGGIYVINASGREGGANKPRPLLSGVRSLSPRAWSPDGTEIAFVEYGNVPDIYKLNVSSLKKVRLTKGPGEEGPPTWSPDGTKVAFPRSGRIYVMNADGSDPTPVSKPKVEASAAATALALDWQPLPDTGGPSFIPALALAAALMLIGSGALALALVRPRM